VSSRTRVALLVLQALAIAAGIALGAMIWNASA
jgi:hypothetical protein